MTRCTAKIEFPELNVDGDVYRIGTLLELVREIATRLAADGKKVRVCVQGSMGQGVFQALPLALSGVARILDLMDWGDAEAFIRRGSIGRDVPAEDDDYFILIAPQNIVGYAVLPYVAEMEEAAGDRPMIMINPKLDDIQSAGNVMSIRGRGERREYVAAWRPAYHFRLLYKKPYFFPIFGALRYGGPGTKWELYKRFGKMATEEYKLMRVYEDGEPGSAEITDVILNRKKA
jgi:adenylate kinase